METTASHTPSGLGEESSIWFKLTPLLNGDPDNPMRILMQMMRALRRRDPGQHRQPARRAA